MHSNLPNIFVLGVGHSGTSIIAKMLYAFGYNKNAADDQFCEDTSFRNIHGRWLSFGFADKKTGDEFHKTVNHDIENFINGIQRPFALKDPRFVLFADIWGQHPLVKKDNSCLLYITKDRDSVAESYISRGEVLNGIPFCHGKYLSDLHDIAHDQFLKWPGMKLHISYENLKNAVALFKLGKGLRNPAGGLWNDEQ